MRVLVLVVALLTGCRSEKPVEPLRVGAASDLTVAFNALAKQYTASTGRQVELTFGSTGLLAKQLSQGAPFDVFAAADVATVEGLAAKGTCVASTQRVFAKGRLVVWTAPGITAPGSLAELADERFKHIALANTEHAPYGRAAKAALEAAGVMGNIKSRLVSGDSVSHALQLVRSGNAEAGLIARSLVTELHDGQQLLVDDSLHPPLNQAAIACGTDENRLTAAKQFLEVLRTSGALLAKYGFESADPPQ